MHFIQAAVFVALPLACLALRPTSTVVKTVCITPTPKPSPSIPPFASDCPYRGCFADDMSLWFLSESTYTSETDMSVEACASYCEERDLHYIALESGDTCFCASSFPYDTATREDDSECSAVCTDPEASDEYCGGSSRLQVYGPDPPAS